MTIAYYVSNAKITVQRANIMLTIHLFARLENGDGNALSCECVFLCVFYIYWIIARVNDSKKLLRCWLGSRMLIRMEWKWIKKTPVNTFVAVDIRTACFQSLSMISSLESCSQTPRMPQKPLIQTLFNIENMMQFPNSSLVYGSKGVFTAIPVNLFLGSDHYFYARRDMNTIQGTNIHSRNVDFSRIYYASVVHKRNK